MKLYKILIVDDEVKVRKQIVRLLRSENYETDEAESGEKALEKMKYQNYNVILLDLVMPNGMDGFKFLEKVNKEYPDQCVIILTAYGTTEYTVKAIKMGAFDFLDKPNYPEELVPRIKKAIEQSSVFRETHSKKIDEKNRITNIVGKSQAIQNVFDLIEKVALSKTTVLIQGETGTGKELVALAIHHHSDRSNKPFIVTNCAAIPESLLESELFGHERGAFTGAIRQKRGKCELADGGSLFLDEVGELNPTIQVKLLRFLEDNKFERVGGEETIEVDVRIIAATNKNLQEALSKQEYREDLFYRLNKFPILIPPLRDRKEDIPLLVDHFVKMYNNELNKNINEVTLEALELLMQYHYPGNVRELGNIIERAIILQDGNSLKSDTLSLCLMNKEEKQKNDFADKKFREAKPLFEKEYIEDMLNKTNYNISQAAKLAGMDRTNFKDKIKKYGLRKLD